MIDELHIRDLGVIDDVTLELAPGLNVLTGETGAGKTMIVSALELLTGTRADADRVRAGAAAALVEGRFRPAPPAARDWVSDGDEELVVAREVAPGDRGGRSRARVGGRLAPASALADTIGSAVEIHGQADSAMLSTPAVQRDLLDRSGGPDLATAVGRYRDIHDRWQAARGELERLRAGVRDRARELDRLRFELAEIDAVGPVAGEEEELEAELRRLEHAEQLRGAAAAAAAAITGDAGARDALGAAVSALRAAGGVDDDLDALGSRAEGVAAETQELALDLTAYADTVALDPERLEQLRARRAGLAGLTRKYGADAAAVVAYAGEVRRRADALAAGDERAAELESRVEVLDAELAAAADALSARRRAAGERLAAAVAAHLADLAMPEAVMQVAVEPAEPGPHGADRVRFLLATNAGQPALALAKAASGGERSRVALAVRLALVAAGARPTGADDASVLVFDEVDAGIGGATALDVGRKLADLARDGRRQVLCVTHLAQIAAFADAHFVVAKDAARQAGMASVRRVVDGERITELARMLSGASDSDTAAAHAAELRALASAEATGAPRAEAGSGR